MRLCARIGSEPQACACRSIGGEEHGAEQTQTYEAQIEIHFEIAVVGLIWPEIIFAPELVESVAKPETLEASSDPRIYPHPGHLRPELGSAGQCGVTPDA